MKKNLVQMITMTVVLFLAVTAVHAAPPGSGGGGEAPIDGGISLLLAAGASYGVNKLYKNKKK